MTETSGPQRFTFSFRRVTGSGEALAKRAKKGGTADGRGEQSYRALGGRVRATGAPVDPPRSRSLLERGYARFPISAITRLLTRVPLIGSRPQREPVAVRRDRRPVGQRAGHPDVIRRLHDPAAAGLRRNGRRVPRQAPPTAAPRRAQDPERRDDGRRRIPRTIQPRSRTGCDAVASAHRRRCTIAASSTVISGSRWTTSRAPTPPG